VRRMRRRLTGRVDDRDRAGRGGGVVFGLAKIIPTQAYDKRRSGRSGSAGQWCRRSAKAHSLRRAIAPALGMKDAAPGRLPAAKEIDGCGLDKAGKTWSDQTISVQS